MSSLPDTIICATLPSGRKITHSVHEKSPNDPWIIISNSFSTDISLSEPIAERLANSGFSVLSYDHPGHGKSSALEDVDNVIFEEMIDGIDELLYVMRITSIRAWIGLSLGAASGVYMARRNPGLIQNLIYCGCPPGSLSALGIMSPEMIDKMRDEAEKDGTTTNVIRHMHYGWASKEWLDANPDQDERLKTASSTLSMDAWRAMMTLQKNNDFDMRPMVPDLMGNDLKIMLVKGEKTRESILLAAKEKAVEDNVKMVTVPNSGHVMFLQNEDYFCNVIQEFIS
ncbi:hypothetical protein FCULG_00012435 [Fusarium culmorum]|uniref:AB hydrolase-1 domain-containing protein n=1 Tax=Fusarium culmorum TaxID=5516 RepID=A0A2T4GY95_FUSCU|nr:hypothetical protein FCULG_00012435 [Fusarium culmorum]